jgi:hypothetical protein
LGKVGRLGYDSELVVFVVEVEAPTAGGGRRKLHGGGIEAGTQAGTAKNASKLVCAQHEFRPKPPWIRGLEWCAVSRRSLPLTATPVNGGFQDWKKGAGRQI